MPKAENRTTEEEEEATVNAAAKEIHMNAAKAAVFSELELFFFFSQ